MDMREKIIETDEKLQATNQFLNQGSAKTIKINQTKKMNRNLNVLFWVVYTFHN